MEEQEKVSVNYHYWPKVVKNRGVSDLSIATVLRLWGDGAIEYACEHLRRADAAIARCPNCGQGLEPK